MRNRKRAAALALICALLAPWAGQARAAGGGAVSIRTAEDLMELSQSCTLDAWSRGKTVVLEADLELSGVEFQPIPTFGGTFEGNGHTISGLSLSGGDANQGLFRFLEAGGVVRDLNVRGTVTAGGGQTNVGGIAGSSAGTILDCTFQGTVSGKTAVGGIAGINEAGGTIFGCTSAGSVAGCQYTGGIVGRNLGTVGSCVNVSRVNTVHRDGGLSVEEMEETLRDRNAAETLDTTMNTGGIAGHSSGVVQNCRNEGAVGYPHVGYNTGGIAGCSSGYLDGCSNAGEVLGRKDVGGIAGQLVPHIRLVFSQDVMDRLQTELDALDRLVGRSLDHAQQNRELAARELSELSGYTQSAADSVSDLAQMTASWVDGNLEKINDLSAAAADTLERLADITEGGRETLLQAADGIDRLEDSLDALSRAMGSGEEGMDDLARAVQRLREANRHGQDALTAVQAGLEELARAWVVEDQDALEAALTQLKTGLRQLQAAMEETSGALDTLLGLVSGGGGQEELLQALTELSQGLRDGTRAVGQLSQGILGVFGTVEVDWSRLQEGLNKLISSAGDLAQASGALDRSLSALRAALSHLSDAAGGLEDSADGLAGAMEVFQETARDMGNTAEAVHTLFRELAQREPVEFDTLGPRYQELGDSLHSAVSGMGGELDQLREQLNASGDTLAEDLRSLESKFQDIADLMLEAVADAREREPADLWRDVSEEEIDRATMGKVKGCLNQGPVEGDLNVGGVAGAMAIENDLDPEDDITREGTESMNFRYETTAILQSCVNRGSVTAKKDAAGGLTGLMELGFLLDCENYGPVKSQDGDYVGGIAGRAASTIRGCWSKCLVSGGRWVGGIAGWAGRLYDCTALVEAEAAQGQAGAVAGGWDPETGELLGNRFVSAGLAGVDGVSYAGRAEPVDYAALMEEAVPADFRRFTVTYAADGVTVGRADYSYGEALREEEIPPVPPREGYDGVWEPIGTETVTFDYVVEAVYTPSVGTLASRETRDGVRSVFLAVGDFHDEGTLRVQAEAQEDGMERWTVALEGGEGPCQIRFLPPGGWRNISLKLTTEDGTQTVQWERNGSYCVFQTDAVQFELTVLPRADTAFLGLILAICLLCAAVCVMLLLKHRKNRAARAAGPGTKG